MHPASTDSSHASHASHASHVLHSSHVSHISLRIALPLALLLMLLLAACGQVAAKPHASAIATTRPSPTTPPTTPPAALPTALPMPTITAIQASGDPTFGKTAYWSHANLPTGFGMQFHVSDLQVAASDGNIAYSCAVPGDQTQPGHPRVVVTRNGGASWTYVTSLPVSWDACVALAVDMLDPSVVIATQDFSAGTQEITFDGGGSWQTLALPPQEAIFQLATRGSSTYALISTPTGTNGATAILAESSDHLHTWHEIDGNLKAANLRQFWLNPGNGALLLETISGLWTSSDNGATWTPTSIPGDGSANIAVQQPIANQPWRICTAYYATQNSSSPSLACTADGGHTWFAPPLAPFWQVAGIASDGAVLVYSMEYRVFRFPAGATQWQVLGDAPKAGCCISYIPSTAGGVLWKFPAESDGAGIPDKPNDVYSAMYPY